MKRFELKWSIVISVVICLHHSQGVYAGCSCQGDVNNSGTVNVIDAAVIADCANNITCAGCVNNCDVNCDGTVDWLDLGAMWCAFVGQSDCCNKPDGACTSDNPNVPACVVTYERACTDDPGLFTGTYHGDNTICQGDEAIDIPAASDWGLAVLALFVLIGGSMPLRSRSAEPRT